MSTQDAGSIRRTALRAARGSDQKPPAYFKIMRKWLPAKGGGQKIGSFNHWEWDVSGNCLDPIHRDLHGRPFADRPATLVEGNQAVTCSQWLELTARCRKCETCMAMRASLWRGRLLGELRASQAIGKRVWMVTLTAGPTTRWDTKMAAMKRFNDRGKGPGSKAGESSEFLTLSESERFALNNQILSAKVTTYFKRLRHLPVAQWRERKAQERRAMLALGFKPEVVKAKLAEWVGVHPCPPPARFRYLCVTEAHKKSEVFPHYHILIHEVEGLLSERELRGQWRSRVGFAHAKLVSGDPLRMLYLCKYLTKDNRARVRSSIGYGNPELAFPTPFDLWSKRIATDASVNQNKTPPLKEPTPVAFFTETGATHEVWKERPGNHGLPCTRLSVPTEGSRLSTGNLWKPPWSSRPQAGHQPQLGEDAPVQAGNCETS